MPPKKGSLGKACLDEVLDEAIVKIFSAKVSVSCCGLDLENTLINGQQRDIKRSAAQIKDEDVPLSNRALLIQTCTWKRKSVLC